MSYEEQLSVARFKAERDLARQELDSLNGKIDELCEEVGVSPCFGGSRLEMLEKMKESVKQAMAMSPNAQRLLQEDEDAAMWVREHGGLECLEEVESMSDLMGKVCDIIRVHDWEYSDRSDFEREVLCELGERLMPEGYEWPRYEDGEPVLVGDAAEFGSDDSMTITGVELTDDSFILHGRNGSIALPCQVGYKFFERVKRPQVLTADGEPIEIGMDVWWVCEGDERGVHAERLHVESVGSDGLVECSPYNGGTWVELESSELHVRKPVLDADGVPIHEGDTVYFKETGEPTTVVNPFTTRLDPCHTVECYDGFYPPEKLTHTKPERDSWERIEDDATKQPYSYCVEHGLDDDGIPTNEKFALDLIRRCKALAERG